MSSTEMPVTVNNFSRTPPDEGEVYTFDIALFFFTSLSTIGMLGNALVCFVMLVNKRSFSSTTNRLIIHQSVLDFTSAAFFLARSLTLLPPPVADNLLARVYCRAWWSEWPQYSMFLASTYNLVAISIERYLATCYPVKHRNMFSKHRLKFVIVATWCAGWIPLAHLLLISFYSTDLFDCEVIWPSDLAQALGGVATFLYTLVIPILIITFAYSRIIWTLHRRSKVRQEDNNTAARVMLSRANRNVTITLIVVAVFFVICWMPTAVNYLLFNLNVSGDFNDPGYQVTVVVTVNFCVNPIIYSFTYERFRKHLLRMFCRCLARNRVGPDADRASTVVDNLTRNPSMATRLENTATASHLQPGCSQDRR